MLWISLTISRHSSLLSIAPGWSSRQHLDSVDRFLLVDQTLLFRVKGSTGVHHLWVRSYFFCKWLACLVSLIWMVFEMGDWWPYSCCFEECCRQDLFNSARNILMQLPSSFFSIRLVSDHVAHPINSIDTTADWKNSVLSYQIGVFSLWSCADVIFHRWDAVSALFTWRPMPPAACSRLCSLDSASEDVLARSAMSSALSASVIVCVRYRLLLAFAKLKPFSFIKYIDILNP